jgi:restriction system protein
MLCVRCIQEAEVREAQEHSRAEAHAKREQAEREAREAERLRRQEDFSRRMHTLEFLRALDPYAFQQFTWLLYRHLGYSVRECPEGRDGGVDGFLAKGSMSFVLQCKRYQGDVGEPFVRDLFGTMVHHSANGAIMVTTGSISKPAREFARGKRIDLVDGDMLLTLIRQADIPHSQLPSDVNKRHFGRYENEMCPKCGQLMVIRRGRHGRFYGCRGYPKCRFTKRV